MKKQSKVQPGKKRGAPSPAAKPSRKKTRKPPLVKKPRKSEPDITLDPRAGLPDAVFFDPEHTSKLRLDSGLRVITGVTNPKLPEMTAPLKVISAKYGEPTDALIAHIARLILLTLSHPVDAMVACGIPRTQARVWLETGIRELSDEKSQFARLVQACDTATEQAAMADLHQITLGGKKEYISGLTWRLERRKPSRWGPVILQRGSAPEEVLAPPPVEDLPVLDIRQQASVLTILEAVGYLPKGTAQANAPRGTVGD